MPRFSPHASSWRRILLASVVAVASSTLAWGQAAISWPGETWEVSTPEAEGIHPDTVAAIVADMESGAYGYIDAFMLIRHGRVVADYRFEQDYETLAAQYDTTNYPYNYDHPDWHPYLKDTDLHSLQSVTKSVLSAALGIAIDDGHIEDVHVPAMSFFEAYRPFETDARKEAMTLEDLLTMRSGLLWQDTGGYDSDEHDTIKLEASDAWIQFVLDKPSDSQPGTRWQYNDGASVLIGKILREATGQRADDWARDRLFQPLGIDAIYWKITPDGEADTEGGLYLRTEDLARIGYLFLRGGEWNGTQVISREWVEASTAPVVPHIRGPQSIGYGYQWWVPRHENGHARIFAANGYGGQFLLVSPEHDIVAVFNGWTIHEQPDKSTWLALQQRILPALID
ncbi:MAG: serine hydrolase [Bacteroidota bacterium]